jgi:large subunit ribosomal protein L3
MTRFFGENGESIPVTAILAGPCHVVQVKTGEKEGYQAVQLGAFPRRKKLVSKPQQGHFAKAKVDPAAKLVEFRVEQTEPYQPGQELRVDIFQVGDLVKVTGTSKGRGFAGGIKRWGFHGGPKTHGQSDRHRAPGSLGGSSYPSRVWKGKKMAGRMGGDRISVRNLEIVQVDLENNLLLVKGAVPGARNSFVLIQRTTELIPAPPAEEKGAGDKADTETATEAVGAAAAAKTETGKKKTAAGDKSQPKDAASETKGEAPKAVEGSPGTEQADENTSAASEEPPGAEEGQGPKKEKKE